MADTSGFIGKPVIRVDGVAKVTGAARYAAEYHTEDLLHAVAVSATITRGKILSIDTEAALAVPGVVHILTHENRPDTARWDLSYRDMVGPPGHPLRPLYDEHIHHNGQPIALVIAETFEAARDATVLVNAQYDVEAHLTDFAVARASAYDPPKRRMGIKPPQPRGDPQTAFATALVKIEAEYHLAAEIHNPMEMFAATVILDADGVFNVYDKTQGALNVQFYLTQVFKLPAKKVRVIAPYVGGAFGSALRPQPSVYLAMLAAKALKRSVRVTLSRAQMFDLSCRPETLNHIKLSADSTGKLTSIHHHAIGHTSAYEDHQETVVNWSGLLYQCANVDMGYKLIKLDTMSPGDMRAPGAAVGVFALESAMDELAYALDIDPLDLRRINYADHDQNDDKVFTSKALRDCYDQGANAFGWAKRSSAPRSMREDRDLIGWGVAGGVWDAPYSPVPTRARAELSHTGHLTIISGAADIGTGTYTIATQIAAETMGLPIEAVTVRLGDSKDPFAAPEGGSMMAASVGSAVQAACQKLQKALFKAARDLPDTPFKGRKFKEVAFRDGQMIAGDVAVPFTDIMTAVERETLGVTATVLSNYLSTQKYISYAHTAVFAEVRVDEDLGVVRVTRLVNAVAAGRILNPRTARSQITGAMVMAIGQALHEETLTDHRLGRIMNHNFAEYHIPAHADVIDLDVIFVDEADTRVNPIGAKGLGEIGIVGTAAAIANAIFHATGRRMRDLPITLDKVLYSDG
ncbi:xanthine dehydrogenase family protein molybdopterin-binding subunit [Asticcacaulis sp. YBE204]|uniref:xanthine dehydrogenase family protein molybdopterin-binding subunit n=1 Tax=Asticcacaulis sp. YBE204 TaxID=1282363 RepID=UPI0003C3B45C|nr:xanthine dehydrogenase family protein molybdopterin-binding subunit [Asticcacaulis sp. YBE204]ESQ79377.1 hypothetical protein AEYBE204_10230 [Asticcacaulis sp. YBE204]